ncbi:Sec-independent protein translocase TatB [uncultured Pseudokineococcus sp.]|uniref:Sec-independent protein translocase TatB n=1 Tax=uncultured Pseudokineococcus sp. TaxID=1642928 RepID=UPI002612C2B1|nr:Sec-independent protein translocase TatB [uncultured Pseudokineococcus sp.]
MSFPNGGELLVLLVIVLVVVGPERLPRYSQQLADLVRGGVRYAKGARDSLKEEMGPEFDDIDWQKLDPRQYDPRRIVRDALTDVWDDPPAKPRSPGAPRSLAAPAAGGGGAAVAAAAATGGSSPARPPVPSPRGGAEPRVTPDRTPFDDEAT